MADYFAPDINFQSVRGIYPTAPGGTVASSAAAMSATTNMSVSNGTQSGVTPTNPTTLQTSGRSVIWWAGFVATLLIMVFIARKAGGPEDFRNIRPTFYNFLTITLTAIVGIVGLKILAAKWHIPGASDVILAA